MNLRRVREMLDRTELLLGEADERTSRVELLAQKAAVLLDMLKQSHGLLRGADGPAAHRESQGSAAHGSKDKPKGRRPRKGKTSVPEGLSGRTSAAVAAGVAESSSLQETKEGIQQIVQALAGEVRALQLERLPFLPQAASGAPSAVKDIQYEILDMEAIHQMLNFDLESHDPEITPPDSPEVLPPRQPEITPIPNDPEIKPDIQPERELPELPADPEPLPQTPPELPPL